MISYGFFDSINHDRRYSALDFGRLFDGLIEDGIFGGVGDAFNVTASSNGMIALVGSGRAWIDYTWTYNDYALPIKLSNGEINVTRIDAIVIEVNHETRSNSIKVVEGSSLTPNTRPTWTNTDTVKKFAIAYVTIPKNTVTLTNDMITMAIGEENNPLAAKYVSVDSSVDQADIDNIISSWTNKFNEVFTKWKQQQETEFEQFMTTVVNHLNSNQIGQLYAAILNKENVPHTLKAVLTAGDMYVSFTSDYINDNSLLEIYTDPFGMSLFNISQSGHTVNLTFKPVSHDTTVILMIRETNTL